MTQMFGLCPRCKTRIKINDVEKLNGRKIACRECGYEIRIHDPKARVSKEKSEELEIVDFEDGLLDAVEMNHADQDEYTAAIEESDLPAYKPRTRLPKKAIQKKAEADSDADAAPKISAKAAAPKSKHSSLFVVLICTGALVVVGLLGGGFVLLRSSGFGTAAKFEAPEKYVPLKVGIAPFTGVMPDGWQSGASGGIGGIPIFAKISDGGSITIDIRQTEGSSAKGKMKKAIASGQEVHQIGGPSVGRIDESPAVASTHEYHRGVVTKDFMSYKEGSSRPIETGYGEGRISDFTGREGLFSGSVKGCRATVVSAAYQWNIVCKCPPAQFKDVLPVFEKIIGSLSPVAGAR
jgi:DNA-directed RNA polymerase subunit RPC12/RpoP